MHHMHANAHMHRIPISTYSLFGNKKVPNSCQTQARTDLILHWHACNGSVLSMTTTGASGCLYTECARTSTCCPSEDLVASGDHVNFLFFTQAFYLSNERLGYQVVRCQIKGRCVERPGESLLLQTYRGFIMLPDSLRNRNVSVFAEK
jgi:hypothetical protein